MTGASVFGSGLRKILESLGLYSPKGPGARLREDGFWDCRMEFRMIQSYNVKFSIIVCKSSI